MIGKKTLKDYGYSHIEDYFNYIIESYINGNFSQVKDLFKKMNKEQREYFINWLSEEETFFSEKINLMGYLLK
jgi:hypothetical protein